MTNDIKKDFNQFKKDIKKEGIDLTGCCYMTKKQIENRTATILICNNIPFEEEIRGESSRTNQVMNYTSWTDAEKVETAKRAFEKITAYTKDLMQYGTKKNFYDAKVKAIMDSSAWKNFCKGAVIVTSYDEKDIGMYLRINW